MRLTLTLQQSAQIGARFGTDQVTRSEAYVPGWQIRGAFAAAWIRAHGVSVAGSSSRQQFVDLFESKVRFGPAFMGAGPTSLAVYRHKYHPAPTCANPTIDRAVNTSTQQLCPTCDQEWVPSRGIPTADTPPVDRRTGVQIGRNDIAVDQQLFARESIRHGTRLTADVTSDQDGLLAALVDLGRIQIGGRRSSYGLATPQWEHTATPLGAQVRQDGRVVVRLMSPAVFVDDTGRPSAAPSATELTEIFGAATTVEQQWTRWDQVGGWHMASQLPKHTETVVTGGSTYLLTVQGGVNNEQLRRLWLRGLGLRRHEGFGHVAPAPIGQVAP